MNKFEETFLRSTTNPETGAYTGTVYCGLAKWDHGDGDVAYLVGRWCIPFGWVLGRGRAVCWLSYARHESLESASAEYAALVAESPAEMDMDEYSAMVGSATGAAGCVRGAQIN